MGPKNDAADFNAPVTKPGVLMSIKEHQEERDHLTDEGGHRPGRVSTK